MIELLFAGTLVATGPAPALAAAAMQAERPIAHDAGIASGELLEFDVERTRRMTVPVTIAGQGPFRFIIDTGSQATTISNGLAARLALVRSAPTTLIAMNSRRAVETAAVPELNFARRAISIPQAPLVDRVDIGEAEGILGLDTLQNRRVLFDFINNVITVAETSERPASNGYEIIVRAERRLGQLIITQAEIDGVSTAVIIDTGTESSIGNAALFDRLRRAGLADDREIIDVNGVEERGETKIARSLAIDRVRFRDIPVTHAPSPIFEALGLTNEPALLLGMSELRLFERVAIDFGTREILFDVPSNADRLPLEPNTGATRLRR